MNPVSVSQFRSDFAEFADPSKYPDSLLTTWFSVAAQQLQNVDRWGTLLTMGQELMAAHYIAVAARDRDTGSIGGIPGQPSGLQTAKSVGDVCVSYDHTSVINPDAGFWNQTSYGQRYFKLAYMIGAGGLQLSPGCWPD